MNFLVRVPLNTDAEQHARLLALQTAFAAVCNALAPTVQQTRVWNRVALHHLCYRKLREQFPDLGSQMVCNAIYSVSRASRLVYQHPRSPCNIAKFGAKPLPLLCFSDTCPVYFDRHTLSVKNGQLSMFTLDGRIRFALALSAEVEVNFHQNKLREVELSRGTDGRFFLNFSFGEAQRADADAQLVEQAANVPDYLKLEGIL